MPRASSRRAWDEAALRALEREALAEGHPWVAGLDEAGRGPLAGPVVAACVIPPEGSLAAWAGLTDSKALSAAARAALVPKIEALALAHGLGWASAAEVDAHNVLQATMLAMQRAVEAAWRQAEAKGLGLAGPGPQGGPGAGLLLVDGNRPLRSWLGPQWTVVKGDARALAIAAASVLAKEARDAHLLGLEGRHPGYGFAQHKGYGTPAHWRALEALGPCAEHRLTFLRRRLGGPQAGPG